MIDVHCHLEQPDYDKDRGSVIEDCKKELKAIITSCAHPKDITTTLNIAKQHAGFVFPSIGLHPEYIKELSEEQINSTINTIKENKEQIVALGEIGLDYYWIKEEDWRQKQKELFVQLIKLAKELDLPLIIHSRNAVEETIEILEQQQAKRVLMHMFGAHQLLQKVIDNGWSVSINTMVLKSKSHRKVAKRIPAEKLMLETDSPWLGEGGKRNTPLSIKAVAEKIAELRKTTFAQIWSTTAANAVKFFNLPIKI